MDPMENYLTDTIQLYGPPFHAGDRGINKTLGDSVHSWLGKAGMEIIKHLTNSYLDFKIQLKYDLFYEMPCFLLSPGSQSLSPLGSPSTYSSHPIDSTPYVF